jgi:hypothetical protein
VAVDKTTTLDLSALGVVKFSISLYLLKVFPWIIRERLTYFLTSRYLKEYIKYYFVLKFEANEKPTIEKKACKIFHLFKINIDKFN